MSEPKTCQVKKYDKSPCGREVFNENDKYCIFHSEDIEGKKDKFDEAFEEEYNRQNEDENNKVLDFSRFVFPKKFSFFRTINIEKPVCFRHAIFSNTANFFGVTFFKKADFGLVAFYEKVIFNSATFSEARFIFAAFFAKAHFNGASFSDMADFREASFTEANFRKATFSRAFFRKATFSKMGFFSEATFFEKADFSEAYFEDVVGLFDIGVLVSQGKYLRQTRYKISNFRFTFGHKASAKYPVIHRKSQDEWFLNDYKNQHPFIFKIWKISSNCGRSLTRWGLLSLGLALLFSIIFILIGEGAFKPREYTWFSWFYYSIVTFTTLGFGDITPIKWYSEIVVVLEVILGYGMLGGLISIFANKLARRS